MATIIRGRKDKTVLALREALVAYEERFKGSEASLYRQNPGSIYIRIIDDRFAGTSKSRRHDQVWRFLRDRVGDDIMEEVSVLLPMPRSELESSLANMDFEDPVPSGS